jgi:predicted nucleotidyltransferase component of viral defense system
MDERLFREVFHFLFLENLLKISDPKFYILKGGVNLRFFFKSIRYSEDMDIDVFQTSVSTLKKNGYKILRDQAFLRALKTYGVENIEISDPEKAKHTETTQRFRLRLVTSAGERLPTKIEFSRRSKCVEGTALERVDPEVARRFGRLAFSCHHYSGEAAFAQKVEALAGRPSTQARDLFDLDLLLRSGAHATPTYSSGVKNLALKNLEKLNFEDFKDQVLAFLEINERKNYAKKDVWEEMKREVARAL